MVKLAAEKDPRLMKKTYLVSGAGSGIGRAAAISIARSSPENSLVLLGRRKSQLEETRSLLPDPSSHISLAADLRSPGSLKDLFQSAELAKRNLVGVIANAGVGGENHYGPGDRWSEILDTNLSGTYYLVNEALPFLRAAKADFKHVVITSSILARLGVPGYSAYCASKAGLLGLMRSWASELAGDRILVNAICPGWVETEMATQGLKAMSDAQNISFEQAKGGQMAMVPLKKMAKPEEVGELLAFLVSGKQSSITGQCLDINNGALMA